MKALNHHDESIRLLLIICEIQETLPSIVVPQILFLSSYIFKSVFFLNFPLCVADLEINSLEKGFG